MIKCKNCGYEGIFETKKCPRCSAQITLDENGIEKLRREVLAAREAGEIDMLAESYRTLALAGDTEGEREYAKLLEKGLHTPRDVDLAMDYFLRAAKKGDAFSAYRYSRLISRTNDELSRFWLLFSAALGCSDAYLAAAEEYSRTGDEAAANYYYSLADEAGEADATVRLASRYYYGEGFEPNASYAKRYMEKLTFPPIYALKLAYKLRQVKSEAPPKILPPENNKVTYELISKARRLGIKPAEMALYQSLASDGNDESACKLASVYIEGRITERNPDEAIRILSRAAAGGGVSAYVMLGNLYLEGKDVKQSFDDALRCYEAAAKLGCKNADEYIADVYHHKNYIGRDVAKAYELYTKAAKAGSATAKSKAEAILSAREGYYYHASRNEAVSPKDAFRGYAIATVMGHAPAMLKLAECYALGIGVAKNRKEAFLWYKKAYDSGLSEANMPLGVCYGRGVGTAFNYRLAVGHLRAALSLGDERAKREISRLYENRRKALTRRYYSAGMRLIYMGKYSVAKAHLEVAAQLKHPKAIYTLGALYEFGRGAEADRAHAYSLYLDAEGLGFTDTRSAYKSKILRMLKKA